MTEHSQDQRGVGIEEMPAPFRARFLEVLGRRSGPLESGCSWPTRPPLDQVTWGWLWPKLVPGALLLAFAVGETLFPILKPRGIWTFPFWRFLAYALGFGLLAYLPLRAWRRFAFGLIAPFSAGRRVLARTVVVVDHETLRARFYPVTSAEQFTVRERRVTRKRKNQFGWVISSTSKSSWCLDFQPEDGGDVVLLAQAKSEEEKAERIDAPLAALLERAKAADECAQRGDLEGLRELDPFYAARLEGVAIDSGPGDEEDASEVPRVERTEPPPFWRTAPEKGLVGGALLGVVVTLAVGVYVDVAWWEDILRRGEVRVEDVEWYVRRGWVHVGAAREMLPALKYREAAGTWDPVLGGDRDLSERVAALRRFVEEFPDTPQAEQARDLADQLVGEAWLEARAPRTNLHFYCAELERFIEEVPDRPEAEQARALLAELEPVRDLVGELEDAEEALDRLGRYAIEEVERTLEEAEREHPELMRGEDPRVAGLLGKVRAALDAEKAAAR